MQWLEQNLIALQERRKETMASFLQTELSLGHTFCSLAKMSQEPALVRRRLLAAQAALDALSKFMWKANLEPRELDQLNAQIERLEFELAAATSSNPGR